MEWTSSRVYDLVQSGGASYEKLTPKGKALYDQYKSVGAADDTLPEPRQPISLSSPQEPAINKISRLTRSFGTGMTNVLAPGAVEQNKKLDEGLLASLRLKFPKEEAKRFEPTPLLGTRGENIAEKAGGFLGFAAPVGAAYGTGGKLASAGIKRFAPNAPKLLQNAVRDAGAGTALGTAEGISRGESLPEIGKTAAQEAALFVTLGVGAGILSKAAKGLWERTPQATRNAILSRFGKAKVAEVIEEAAAKGIEPDQILMLPPPKPGQNFTFRDPNLGDYYGKVVPERPLALPKPEQNFTLPQFWKPRMQTLGPLRRSANALQDAEWALNEGIETIQNYVGHSDVLAAYPPGTTVEYALADVQKNTGVNIPALIANYEASLKKNNTPIGQLPKIGLGKVRLGNVAGVEPPKITKFEPPLQFKTQMLKPFERPGIQPLRPPGAAEEAPLQFKTQIPRTNFEKPGQIPVAKKDLPAQEQGKPITMGNVFPLNNLGLAASPLATTEGEDERSKFLRGIGYAGLAVGGLKAIKDNPQAFKVYTPTVKEAAGSVASSVARGAAGWKDKAKLLLKRETMERNFEDIMGKDAPKMIKEYLDPIHKGEANRMRWLNKERQEVKSLGIAPKSKDSGLLQKYGEGAISLEELKQATPNWQKVTKANEVIRKKYDSYLDQINEVLTRNEYDPIPRRKDYFRHFQEVSDVLERFGVPIKDNALPTDINGLSADFRPGKNFFASALERKGNKTTLDAIQGIDKYLDGASKLIYQTDNIQRLRAFDKALRTEFEGKDHLANFVAEVTEYTNQLAGKKAMMDRAVEDLVGRQIYSVADRLRKQVGANLTGMNVASALTNYIPLTQSLATTNKSAFVQGMLQTVGNVFKNDGFVAKSDFLARRVGSDPLTIGLWERAQKAGFWMFGVVDKFTSQVVVRSKYLEGIQKGLGPEQAMKQADSWAARIMADRSAGSMPTLFNSRTLGLLTQFQLEVNNQISFMFKDIPRSMDKAAAASALAQVFLYGYIFNNLYEKAIGRRPAFDPIYVVHKARQDYNDPEMKDGKATQNLVRNAKDQLPFANVLSGGRIPLGVAFPNPMDIATGKTDIGKELAKPLTYLLPPTGGGQVKKTKEGLEILKNKGVFNKDKTQLQYPVELTPANKLKAPLFGRSSLPETKDYYEKDRRPLGENQTKLLQAREKLGFDAKSQYGAVLEQRKLDDIDEQIKAIQKNMTLTRDEKIKQIKPLAEKKKEISIRRAELLRAKTKGGK